MNSQIFMKLSIFFLLLSSLRYFDNYRYFPLIDIIDTFELLASLIKSLLTSQSRKWWSETGNRNCQISVIVDFIFETLRLDFHFKVFFQ